MPTHIADSPYNTITEVGPEYWSKVERTSSCWLWTGALSPNGYGKFTVDGRTVYAHIVAYVLAYGPVGEGLQIDHVRERGCTNRHCVNPAHLEAVTQRTNILRGTCPPAVNARKTHCMHGHEFTPGNTRWVSSTNRRCRACHRFDEANRRAMRRRRALEAQAQQNAATGLAPEAA